MAEFNKLGVRAHTVLGENKFKFEPVFSKTQNVGKIGYAFDHAVKNFGMYQFVVLAGCILLDFVIVIIILLVTNPDHKKATVMAPCLIISAAVKLLSLTTN
ncbi:hypothetical protein KRR40_46255 [Niabella defluvii]|nr:hypothetical protein KRR40_46255 [Niabella sp. I65]